MCTLLLAIFIFYIQHNTSIIVFMSSIDNLKKIFRNNVAFEVGGEKL